MPHSSVKSVSALHNVSVLRGGGTGTVRNLRSGQTSELDPTGMTSKVAILYLFPALAEPGLATCRCSGCSCARSRVAAAGPARTAQLIGY